MNKSFFAGLVTLAVAGCGGTTIGTATPAAVPAASTAASTAAAPVNEVQHIDVDKTYLVYMFGGESTATVDMTLDQVVVGASEIPAVQPHPGYVTYGFEFTVRGVSGSGKAWTQNFLAQNSSGSFSANNLAPSDLTASPEEFKQGYIDYSPGSVQTGWVGFAFPAGIKPARVSFEVGSLTTVSIDTSNANPTWYLDASATPAPSRQPACTEQDPAECLLADNAVAGLDTGASADQPAGMTRMMYDIDPDQGFAAAAFKDAHGNIIIADQDADLASPFGTATQYQNWSFAAEAEVILGKRPQGLINDAVAFAGMVKAADTDSAPVYVTGFGLGGVEAQAQAQALLSGIAGGVTFGAPGLPGNTLDSADAPTPGFVNIVDYGDSLGYWSSDPGGPLVALAPDYMNHYGLVDHVGDESSAALPMLAANTTKLSAGSLIAQAVGSEWHDGDGFDQSLRLVPDPAAAVVDTYDTVLKTASYAYLAGSALMFHSIGQYGKDLGVSMTPTVAASISMAEFTKVYQPTASTAALQAADATTVTAAGTVTAPGYDLTADPVTSTLTGQTYTAQDKSQYGLSYDPAEQVSSIKVNDPGGVGSYEIFSDDSGQYAWSTRVDFYSGPDETGTLSVCDELT